MKTKLLIPLSIGMVVTGCTHNNGDIGALYGQWQLTHVETTGSVPEFTMPEGNIYWGFQSSTIHMSWITPTHEQDNRFGNYRLDDNTLFLDFPDEGPQFEPLLGLPRQCEMQLLELTSHKLTVMYRPVEDGALTYYFRKW